MGVEQIHFRYLPSADDIPVVEELVRSTGRFTPDEVGVARELIVDALARGEASGYSYVFACGCGEVLGFTCYGPIPGSQRRYELYWIAVRPAMQGCGIGRRLLAETERKIAELGGVRVYAETSSKAEYSATHAFYRSQGYREVAFLDGYYTEADGLMVFEKRLVKPVPHEVQEVGQLVPVTPVPLVVAADSGTFRPQVPRPA